MHVFGQWEEAGVPGENPRIHGENMQTPHRKAPGGDRNLKHEKPKVITEKPRTKNITKPTDMTIRCGNEDPTLQAAKLECPLQFSRIFTFYSGEMKVNMYFTVIKKNNNT